MPRTMSSNSCTMICLMSACRQHLAHPMQAMIAHHVNARCHEHSLNHACRLGFINFKPTLDLHVVGDCIWGHRSKLPNWHHHNWSAVWDVKQQFFIWRTRGVKGSQCLSCAQLPFYLSRGLHWIEVRFCFSLGHQSS